MGQDRSVSSENVENQPIPTDADRERYGVLVDEIQRYRAAYYNEDAPLVSDAEFDVLYSELEKLEALHPELVTNDSPTQLVGGDVSVAFAAVDHLARMYSLEDVFSSKNFKRGYSRRLHRLRSRAGRRRSG